jgi:autotransporter translocation and assembly factor TamB
MVPEAGHQRFRLKAQMMAVSDKHTIIDIPAGAEVVLLDSIEVSTPTPELNRQVNIQWRGQTLKLFVVDLFERAERL